MHIVPGNFFVRLLLALKDIFQFCQHNRLYTNFLTWAVVQYVKPCLSKKMYLCYRYTHTIWCLWEVLLCACLHVRATDALQAGEIIDADLNTDEKCWRKANLIFALVIKDVTYENC